MAVHMILVLISSLDRKENGHSSDLGPYGARRRLHSNIRYCLVHSNDLRNRMESSFLGLPIEWLITQNSR